MSSYPSPRLALSRLRLVRILVFALAAFAIVLVGCSRATDQDATSTTGEGTPSGTPETRSITFMAGFRPQANLPFVAVYVAEAQGFFADEHLEVDIQHSSGQDEHLKLLLDGDIEFTTGTASQAIKRVSDSLPMRVIALFGQRGDQGYVVRADSGITGPEDFKGHSVGFKAGVVPAELDAMLAGAGLTRDDIELASVGFDPRVFIDGAVDVYPVFINNEPDTIRRAGVDINVIDPADHGVPTLGLTYLANASTVEDDPELVERFLRATLRAVAWIDDHRDEAVATVLEYADGADPDHQRYLLETDLAAAGRSDGIGRWDDAQWQALTDLLLKYELIEHAPAVEEIVSPEAVNKLYEGGEIN